MDDAQREILELMLRAGIPITRENYIALAWDRPEDFGGDAEAETLVPKELRPDYEDGSDDGNVDDAEVRWVKGEHGRFVGSKPSLTPKEEEELNEFPEGTVIQEGKGPLGSGKFMLVLPTREGELIGLSTNLVPTVQAAIAEGRRLLQRQREGDKTRAERKAKLGEIAERLKAGGEVSEADLQLLGLRSRSGLKWFFPAAAELFGITSRQVRPYIKELVKTGYSEMGAKYESVAAGAALQAIAEGLRIEGAKRALAEQEARAEEFYKQLRKGSVGPTGWRRAVGGGSGRRKRDEDKTALDEELEEIDDINPYHVLRGKGGGQFTTGAGISGIETQTSIAAKSRAAFVKAKRVEARLRAEARMAATGRTRVKGPEHPGKGYSKDAYVRRGTIYTSEVSDALLALHEGKKVDLDQPKRISVLLDRLGKITKEMIDKGEKASTFNLCNVTVRGSNLFCAQSKGIARIHMPQMDDAQTVKFVEHLQNLGHQVKNEDQFASFLRATQNELNGAKVAGIAGKLRGEPDHYAKRIIVSEDDYILDGHHHWAAKLGLDAIDNILTNDTKIPIARVNIKIIPLLQAAEAFTGGKGKKGAEESTTGGGTTKKDANPETRWVKGEHGYFAGSKPGPSVAGIEGMPEGAVIESRELAVAIDRGAFTFVATERPKGQFESGRRFEISIAAKKTAGIEEYFARKTDDHPSLYDPQLADLVMEDEGEPYERLRAVPKDEAKLSITPFDRDDVIYRGMSAEEFEESVRRGYMESRGEYNIGGEQEGRTYWSSEVDTAQAYANGFAPWQYIATFEKPGYVVAAVKPGNAEIRERYPTEVAVPGRVATSQIVAAWRGDVFDHRPGERDAIEESENVYRLGGGVGTSSRVVWSRVQSAHDYNPHHVVSGELGGQFTSTPGATSAAAQKKQPQRALSTKRGVAFVSPNVHQLDFKAARNAIQGDRQKALRMASAEVDRQLGNKGQDTDIIGAWADGAENSVMTVIDNADWDRMKTAAAMKGYLADQKSVLIFQDDEAGEAALFKFKATGSIGDIHDGLLKDGVQFHTLEQTVDGANVYVADLDGSAYDAVNKAAERYDTDVEYRVGRAEFVGTIKADGTDREQRDDARRAYEEAIGKSEVSESRGIWQRVRRRWGQALNPDNNSFVREKNGPDSAKLVANTRKLTDVTGETEERCIGFLTIDGKALNIIGRVAASHYDIAKWSGTSLGRVLEEGSGRLYYTPNDLIGVELFKRPSEQQFKTLQNFAAKGKVEKFYIDGLEGLVASFHAEPGRFVTPRDVLNQINKAYPVMPGRKTGDVNPYHVVKGIKGGQFTTGPGVTSPTFTTRGNEILHEGRVVGTIRPMTEGRIELTIGGKRQKFRNYQAALTHLSRLTKGIELPQPSAARPPGEGLLVSFRPNQEKLDRWTGDIEARMKELEAQGWAGNREDEHLGRMQTALNAYMQESEESLNSGRVGLNVVYDVDGHLLAAGFTYIDAENVARIQYHGALASDAQAKMLELTEVGFGDKVTRIEAEEWRDDPESIAVFEKADFNAVADPIQGTTGPRVRLVKTNVTGAAALEHSEEMLTSARMAAKARGYDPDLVDASAETYPFKIGDKNYEAAGLAYLSTGRITIFPAKVSAGTVYGVMAHEIAHQQYQAVLNAREAEWKRIMLDPETIGPKGMRPDGSLPPALAEKYPIYSRFVKHEGDELHKRIDADGITEYSKAYWEEVKPHKVTIETAHHETIAEMARVEQMRGFQTFEKIPVAKEWIDYYRDVMKTYKELQHKSIVSRQRR
jgi:hypothetical protein